MKALATRTVQEGIAHHLKNPVRVYSEDSLQKLRIEKTRDFARCALQEVYHFGTPNRTIVEVGCGTADISGYLANYQWHTYGIDCHGQSLLEANLRYAPYFTGFHMAIAPIGDGPLVDLVILSEVLEHLNEPEAVASSWLKRAHRSVISHPLEELEGSTLSGGDHVWSFNQADHERFFTIGGHAIDGTEVFEMGAYRIILSRGHRVGD